MVMKSRFAILVAGVALLLTVPAVAHHSFSVEYDVKKPVKVTGTVSRLEWTNPHAHLYVDAVDASGAKVTWNFEMASPNILERNGWTRKAVKANDTVVVEGYSGRVDASRGIANSIKFADGKALFAGAPDQQQ
jgi:hypothetical protein